MGELARAATMFVGLFGGAIMLLAAQQPTAESIAVALAMIAAGVWALGTFK